MRNGLTSRFRIVFLAVCLIFLFGAEIRAEFLTVTTVADTEDGVCDSHCSLREAIGAANDGDTVIFATPLRGGTIQLQKTLIIEKELKIDGPNRRRITLKGDGTFRILYITALSGTGPFKFVSLDGLIIRDGAAPGGYGGGVYIYGGRGVTLTDCLITNNHAAIGGGIRVAFGALYVYDSTISDNTSDGSDGAAGIDARYASCLEIVNSTIAGNIAEDGAGGIKSRPEQLLLINSTVSQNVSRGSGLGRVGGAFTIYNGFSVYRNSIIAGNTGETPDAWLWTSFGGNNLIGIGEGSRFYEGENIVGTRDNPIDPRLGPLTDNGRGLPTFAPLPASLAVNAGNIEHLAWYLDLRNDPFDGATDQRGFPRVVGNAIDIGAVEYGTSAIPLTTTITGRVTNRSRGVPRAFVTVRDPGGEARTAVTNPFGYYGIAGLPADTRFTVEVGAKRDAFQSQTLTTEEAVEYMDFAAGRLAPSGKE